MTRRQETLLVSLLLLTLLAIFFGEAIFTGRKLLPVDIAYTDPVYSGYAPAGFKKPHNILLYDQAYQFYPWRVYTSQALRQGFLPFWNPYTYCGAPLMAEDQPAVLYPLNILSYALSPPDAVLFTALARLFIAGLATYWFVRTIGGGKFGALVSSITFTFSGFMIVWLGHPHTNVAAWLPALFLTVEWLYQKPSTRHVAFVALVVAAQLTGGHAETALYTLTAGGAYYLFRVITAWWAEHKSAPSVKRQVSRSGRRGREMAVVRLFSFAAASILGFMLAFVHLVPFWEWLQHSAELEFRLGAGSLRFTRFGPKYWLAGLLPMILPNVFNNPTWPGEYRSFFPGWNFAEQTLYVGVISLPLAAGAVVAQLSGLRRGRNRHEQQVWFLAALGLVALGAALRVPVFDWVNHLPLFRIAAFGRLRLIYTFGMSVLAGFGARDLASRVDQDGVLRIVVGSLAGLAVVGMLVSLVAPRILSSIQTQTASVEVRQLLQEAIWRAFRMSNVGMYWPILVAVAGVLILVLSPRFPAISCAGHRIAGQTTLQALLLLLVVVDLFALGMSYHATIQEELVFPDTPALQLVKQDKELFRVLGTNIDLMPNTSIIHGLYDVRGLDFPTLRYWDFCQAMGGQDWLGYGILLTERLQPKLLGLLNTKYILTSSRLGPKSLNHLRLLAEEGDIKVYQNLSCLPRSFIVHRARVSKDSAEVLLILQDPEFDLRSEIVLEKAVPGTFAPSSVNSAPATAEITRYEANRVTISAKTVANGFLFLSDSYYPDWKAYVDGVETEIYQADYVFRAVYLAAGEHTVEFIYEPRSFKLASLVSLLALLGAVMLWAGQWSWG